MTAEEMKNEFCALYNMMAGSNEVSNMQVFGNVHKQMFEWFVQNKPELAQEWLDKLSAIRWHQYLTKREAEKITSEMDPKAPWSFDQWKAVMEQHGYALEKDPCYNRYALWVVMDMVMSDSSETISKYVAADKQFDYVYEEAVNRLTDKDKRFNVRGYFGL